MNTLKRGMIIDANLNPNWRFQQSQMSEEISLHFRQNHSERKKIRCLPAM